MTFITFIYILTELHVAAVETLFYRVDPHANLLLLVMNLCHIVFKLQWFKPLIKTIVCPGLGVQCNHQRDLHSWTCNTTFPFTPPKCGCCNGSCRRHHKVYDERGKANAAEVLYKYRCLPVKYPYRL